MKKLLILILIALVLTLTIFTVVNGFEIGSVQVLGISGIQSKNAELDKKIAEATKLANVEFLNKKSTIDASIKEMEDKKTTYEDMIAVSSDSDIQSAKQIPKYKIEFLWTTIGTHATKEGVIIKLDIVNGSGGEDTYNLNFTATGSYVGISEFITDIEDDSSLGFKIEEFAIKPGASDSNLSATFVCKNITIEDISQVQSNTTNTTNETSDTTNSNTTNTTNTTNTNTTNNTDTTNVTNTTNTTNNTNS